MEVRLRAVEAHPGALNMLEVWKLTWNQGGHPRVMEVHPGANEAHLRAFETHPGPCRLIVDP